MIRSAFSIGAIGMLIGIAVLVYRNSEPSPGTPEKVKHPESAKAPAPRKEIPCARPPQAGEPSAPALPEKRQATPPQRAPQWVRPATGTPPVESPPKPGRPTEAGPRSGLDAGEQVRTVAEPDADPDPGAKGNRTHTVVAGDTLWSISRRYYGTPKSIARIVEANGMRAGAALYPGQILVLPGPSPERSLPPPDADHEMASVKKDPRESATDPEQVEEFQPMPPSLSHPIRIMP